MFESLILTQSSHPFAFVVLNNQRANQMMRRLNLPHHSPQQNCQQRSELTAPLEFLESVPWTTWYRCKCRWVDLSSYVAPTKLGLKNKLFEGQVKLTKDWSTWMLNSTVSRLGTWSWNLLMNDDKSPVSVALTRLKRRKVMLLLVDSLKTLKTGNIWDTHYPNWISFNGMCLMSVKSSFLIS